MVLGLFFFLASGLQNRYITETTCAGLGKQRWQGSATCRRSGSEYGMAQVSPIRWFPEMAVGLRQVNLQTTDTTTRSSTRRQG